MSYFLVSLFIVSCTYGPKINRVRVEQILGVENSYTAYAIVQSKDFRKPTGINTFPNGGVNWIMDQNARIYRINSKDRNIELIANLSPDKDIWKHFTVRFIGFNALNKPFIVTSGCMKGGECYPPLRNYRYFSLTCTDTLESLKMRPPDASLPGNMLARRRGEAEYVRYSIKGNTIWALFKENGDSRPIFRVTKDGTLIESNSSENRVKIK